MESILAVKQLSKSYGKRQVLNKVHLNVCAGEVRCILGPNGAGKTTLISAVLGLIKADSGDIVLFGQRQQSKHRSPEVRQRLGVMMQVGSLSANLSVAEQCDLFSSYFLKGYQAAELVKLAGFGQAII